MPSEAATKATSWLTSFSIRFCALIENSKVKTKMPTQYLIVRSLSKAVAMIRGLSCALAT